MLRRDGEPGGILGGFQRISAFFTGFPNARHHVAHRRRIENLITPHERARQKVLHRDTRFRHVAGFPALRWLWTWHWRTQSRDFGQFLDDFAMFDNTIIHRALHHPLLVVWQIWFHQVADDIDQVQDNIVVILRVPVFRIIWWHWLWHWAILDDIININVNRVFNDQTSSDDRDVITSREETYRKVWQSICQV